MKDRRQDDYDGHLDYEYIKLLSAAVAPSSNSTHR